MFKPNNKNWHLDKSSYNGLAIPDFLFHLDKTFSSSIENEVIDFFNKHKNITKWMICSDYVFDNNRKYNVLVCSAIPYVLELEEYKSIIKKIAPTDIKNTKTVSDEFINFLNDMPIINFCFLFNKKRRFLENDMEILKFHYTNLIDMLKHWKKTTPQMQEYYEEIINNLSIFMQDLNGKKNIGLKRDIYLIGTIVSYIASQIVKTINIETIGWFSDRDSLLFHKIKETKSPIIFDIIHCHYHVFCENLGIYKKPNLLYGMPESSEEMFYDELNRIPDLLAGIIANYDFEKNLCSSKFIKPLERLLTNSEKIKILKIILEKEKINTARIIIQKNLES